MCLCECMAHACRYPQRPYESVWSHGAGVKGTYEPQMWVLGTNLKSSRRAESSLSHWGVSPAQKVIIKVGTNQLTVFLYYEHGKIEWVAILLFKKQKSFINFSSLYVILRFLLFLPFSLQPSSANCINHYHCFPALESLGLCHLVPVSAKVKNCAKTAVHSAQGLPCLGPFLHMMT